MIGRIFARSTKPSGRAAPQVPAGLRVYAIGDIHGRADLLDKVHAQIQTDVDADRPAQILTIYLGDYVDRGSDSSGVLERLCQDPVAGSKRILLMGNHEQELLRFLHDPEGAAQWRFYGGLETLLSYRVDVKKALQRDGLSAVAEEFQSRLPAHHEELLRGLDLSATVGDYFFCHAGVDPDLPLAQQNADDLLWIRGRFLDSSTDFGKVVVHGHSIVEKPEFRPNRINIDTGAYATNRLTCLVIEGAGRRILADEPHLAR